MQERGEEVLLTLGWSETRRRAAGNVKEGEAVVDEAEVDGRVQRKPWPRKTTGDVVQRAPARRFWPSSLESWMERRDDEARSKNGMLGRYSSSPWVRGRSAEVRVDGGQLGR
jgi:hypothetical protein